MITIRMPGGAIVGSGKNLSAILRYSRRIGCRPLVRIIPDEQCCGATCVFNWPTSYASCEVHFESAALAFKWSARNAVIEE